jgi:hypothetical protein
MRYLKPTGHDLGDVMRRIKLIGALFALIAGMATIGAIPSQLSSASSSTPTISVSEPEIIDQPLDLGKNFTVYIIIENASNLYTWQAGMSFNASVLETISFSEGDFLKEGGSTLWVNGTLDNISGIIVYHAASLIGDVAGKSGSGTLGRIIFKVKQYGNSTLHLTDIILLDPALGEYPEIAIRDYTLRIKIPGDIDGDDRANVFDAALLGKAFGSTPGSPNWNPEADINKDGIVDNDDLTLISENYGKIV